MYNYFKVSVPCRGILFFNKTDELEQAFSKVFPSPVGESYFSMLYTAEQIIENAFPSPVGESYFSIRYEEIKRIRKNVSVPCRGILFFNMLSLRMNMYINFRVSVPCRGILFFNHKRLRNNTKFIVSVPCRGILFFNDLLLELYQQQKNGFRPLSGNLIFQ